MMIGVLSDAHGNEPGFFECYDFLVQHTDSLYYLGDAVGYFPLSNKIIDTLRTNNIHCLKGNHDAMLLGELEYESAKEEVYQIAKCRNAVSKQNLDFLRSLTPEKKVTIECAMDHLDVDIDTAVPLGLIVNELLTNTLKYAFPAGQHGTVQIKLQKQADGVLQLEVSDNGVGKSRTTKGTGFGGQLVALLTQQLGGSMREEVKNGTSIYFEFKPIKAA